MEPYAFSISIQNPQEVENITSHPYAPSISYHTKAQTNNDGVSLTWKDLWAEVPDKKTGGTRSILEGVTGCARPGEMLAIMGPSGSGKSTLLDALAGRLNSNVKQSGDILVNGFKKTLAYGTSAYVTQDDTLISSLTARESVYYSAQLQLPNSMSKAEKKERAETTLREMGLQDCMDTTVEGWGSKGLSGGQKRRVSICIEILTHPKLLFLDEPTSGLDSAASYYVMSRIAKLDRHEGRTIIASIHQPSVEVFALFHNLCLLSSGKTVYFGHISYVNQFFASNGFPCPAFQNPSDHYLQIINKDFDEHMEGSRPTEEVISILTDSYMSSAIFQEVQDTVGEICKKEDGIHDKKKNHASFLTQCFVLTKRSSVNMHRDLGYYWLRLAIYIALSLCIGTLFFDVGTNFTSVQARSSILMFVVTFLTFMTIGGFPSFVEDMKVFERERLNGHYSIGAFMISNTLSSTPYLFLVSVIPAVITYYLTGLRGGFDHFAYFTTVLFSCMMLVESLMMVVASIVPNYLMGIIVGAGIQGMMILASGYFRLPNDLPKPFWRYPMFHIAFHRYAFQGFYKNEFQGQVYMYNEGGVRNVEYGNNILREKWQVEMGHSKWVDLGTLLGMVVVYRVLFWVIIKIVETVKSGMKSLNCKETNHVMVNPFCTP